MNLRATDLLGEHLQEIRALRKRLEESILTNDRLREQLEKKLAEVEKDPGTRGKSYLCSVSVIIKQDFCHYVLT